MQRRQFVTQTGAAVGFAAGVTVPVLAGCLDRGDGHRESPDGVVERAWETDGPRGRRRLLHSQSPLTIDVPCDADDSNPTEQLLWHERVKLGGEHVELRPGDASVVGETLDAETLDRRLDLTAGSAETIAGQANAEVVLSVEIRGRGLPDGASIAVSYVVAVEDGAWRIVAELPTNASRLGDPDETRSRSG